jgi:hypothetical protein
METELVELLKRAKDLIYLQNRGNVVYSDRADMLLIDINDLLAEREKQLKDDSWLGINWQ